MAFINVDIQGVINQKLEKERLAKEAQEKKEQMNRKAEFSPNHYLDAFLTKDETEKEITIRLLPFSPEEPSPFKKVHVHYVRWTKEDGSKGWKQFMCPVGMGKSNKCPFCETSQEARRLKFETQDEAKRREFNNIEFANQARDYWMVRCIDRDHEDHGVKFWRFADSKNAKGIWDSIYSLFQTRQKRGTNIFDLYEGKDIIIKMTRQMGNNGKPTTVYNVSDDDRITPLSTSEETMEKWVNDPLTWEDVYPTKDYNYLAIVVQGDYPVFSKTLNTWVGKNAAKAIENEAKAQELQENLTSQPQDFSSFTVNTTKIEETPTTSQIVIPTPPTTPIGQYAVPEDDDLPF